jgi:hypothetical protein
MDVVCAVTPPARLTSTTDSPWTKTIDVLQPTASQKVFEQRQRVLGTSLAVIIDSPTIAAVLDCLHQNQASAVQGIKR